MNSISNRREPRGLVVKFTVLPERAVNEPDANLNTVLPEAAMPALLSSMTEEAPPPKVGQSQIRRARDERQEKPSTFHSHCPIR